ncbi:hypothetical protein M4914_06025 [Streptomyces somaliensis DSM 40738]|uniref:hypothetical protein n=1 Tax=Streptomyces somaliensis TaxID=78355 RepID=UPI0021C3D02F|nr:hypothetical protein [Streptomyces somaliensis]MCQ0022549.1 hypothetical protein [Streptomyces somaliensis DSM 40738]
MAGGIAVPESSWTAPFTGLSPRQLGKPINALRQEGADPVRKGAGPGAPLEDRVSPATAYWRRAVSSRSRRAA